VRWSPVGEGVRIIDQRLLPGEYREVDLHDIDSMVQAIRTLAVRGAPAIGIMAAMGLAALAQGASNSNSSRFRELVRMWSSALRDARPTAVNLAWAVDRVAAVSEQHDSPVTAAEAMRHEADVMRRDDQRMCRRIGEHGASLLQDGMNILTHCNTGALATAGIGTALAAIYVAHELGMRLHVYASETRPLLQGSRLTAWELARAGIPVTVVAEGAAASLFSGGGIDCCFVGADRITRQGDVANKIGTFSHAVVARAHAVPFYVAAPTSTLDPNTLGGAAVTIEQRDAMELLGTAGHREGEATIKVFNPAFDITPWEYISAIVTDSGIHRPPYNFGSTRTSGG